ncbi:methionine adenosyltransferase [Blattabacterium punctulatus]|uniref:S-adenosylmethionine synthase n=1 Tax=Blattabacterium punctulatus TaxID=164514 RepID=A0ABM6WNJ1_9FLAO|nr:methionine adenosyltransferase [Blattabacterium punctulatus]AWU39865.1 methionine adenosyltransferase [Blattabacterium punctulatus]AWU40410.1 methionine adenosyltransferase [Blattabacterium punctulatus]AWU42663.1 methionine adenosyltransferase [Blattabacterium punctulatus]AWU43209.1 methionine adenosyltransferase [Blattabacterium punctulatus]AWU44865.1 methionine adenosyltransferase [Blattabacterium punctulatus]
MPYLFTSESVSEGHPDKISDQISDAILDHFLAYDSEAKVAIETLVTTGQIVLAGEVNSKTWVNVQKVARDTLRKIGYTKNEYRFNADSCGVISSIQEQSRDLFQGIIQNKKKENQGAGDQGMVFGYAIKETENYMPLSLEISHYLLRELSSIRNEGEKMLYLRPDAKSQVTLEYSDKNIPIHIHTIVISTQHDEFDTKEKMHKRIVQDIKNILIPRVKNILSKDIKKLFTDRTKYYINSTGKFVTGGPHGDTGITGRKIIVDTYGGRGSHGGGSFSGKDPSKVDRSAAYAARHIAKNLVAAGVADELSIQISYAVGIAKPIGIFVNTYGSSKKELLDEEIVLKIKKNFDFRPYAITKRLKLCNPIYEETAVYGHMGKIPKKVWKYFSDIEGNKKKQKVELFTWEKLDYLPIIKEVFDI